MPQKSWFDTTIVVGALYAVVGIVLALPQTHVKAWRLAAWTVSAVLYMLHIAYEQLRLRYPPRSMAIHVATAVGIGASLLAVSALAHSLIIPPDYSRWRLLIALVVWPILTGVPAFICAFVIGIVLRQIIRTAE